MGNLPLPCGCDRDFTQGHETVAWHRTLDRGDNSDSGLFSYIRTEFTIGKLPAVFKLDKPAVFGWNTYSTTYDAEYIKINWPLSANIKSDWNVLELIFIIVPRKGGGERLTVIEILCDSLKFSTVRPSIQVPKFVYFDANFSLVLNPIKEIR